MAAMLSPAQKAMQNLGAVETQEAPAVQASVNETPAQKALRNLGGGTVEQPKQKFTPLGPPALASAPPTQNVPVQSESPGLLKQAGIGFLEAVDPIARNVFNYIQGTAGTENAAPPLHELPGFEAPERIPEGGYFENALARLSRTAGSVAPALAEYALPTLATGNPIVGFAATDALNAALTNRADVDMGREAQLSVPEEAVKGAVLGTGLGALKYVGSPLLRAILGASGMSVLPGAMEGRLPELEEVAMGIPMGIAGAAHAGRGRVAKVAEVKPVETPPPPPTPITNPDAIRSMSRSFESKPPSTPMPPETYKAGQTAYDVSTPGEVRPSGTAAAGATTLGNSPRQSPAFEAKGTPVGKPVDDTPTGRLTAAIDEIIETKLSERGIQPTKEVIPSNVKEETVSPKAPQAKVLTPEQFEAVEPEPQRVPETEATPATAQPVVEMQREAPVFKFEFQKGKHERILKTQGQEAADAYAQEVGAVSEKTLPLQNETEVQTTPEAEFISTREKYAQIEGETDINKLREFARQNGIEDGPDWNASPDKIAHSMASHLALRDTIALLEARKNNPGKADSGFGNTISFALEHVGNWTRTQLARVAQVLGIAVRGTTNALRTAVRSALEKLREETGAIRTVFHGSDEPFTQFEESRLGTRTDPGFAGRGAYTTTNREAASRWGKHVLETEIDDAAKWYKIKAVSDLYKEGLITPLTEKQKALPRPALMAAYAKNITEFTERMKALDYEGVEWSLSDGSKQYVLFKPGTYTFKERDLLGKLTESLKEEPPKLATEAKTKGMPIRAEHLENPFEHAAVLYDGIKTLVRTQLIPLARKLGLAIRGTTEKIRAAVKAELHRMATEKSGMSLLPTKKKYKQPKEFDALPAAIKGRVENSLKTKTPLTVRVAAKRVATALRKEFTTHAPNTEDLANAIEKANYNIGHELNRSFWLSTESRAKSENMLDSMRKKVFGDMKAEDASKLNAFLALNRIVETDNNAIHKGTKHQVGELKPGDAQAVLDSLKQNPTTWKLLNDRAQKYYDFNKNEVLPFLEKEGLISSGQRTALEKSGAKYIPLDYVREAPGVHGDETAPFYAEGSSLSIRHSGIKRIDKGSDNALNVDVLTVVSANVHSLVKRAFKNRASVALWKAANDPALAKQFDIENVTAPKGKALPDAPRGYKYVYSMHAGERRATLVPDFIADEWVSGSEYIGGTGMEVASWLSGSKSTKFLTTGGGNPIAFMGLTPMDIMYTRLTAPEYAIPVVGDFRLAGDLAKAFPDAFLPTKFRQRLSEEGGLPNNIHAESQILGDFENNFLNRLNVGFGMLSRLARAKRIVKQTGDYREAAYKVKQQLPFRRGGRSSKWLDATELPYFNIMVQAASAYGGHIRRNPKSALIAAGSLFAYQTMWSLYNKASFTNDEEVPENVRANNFYFHTGIMVRDAKGREREVLALVRKDQFARSIGAVAEVAADLTVSDLDDASKAKELERLKNGLLQSINLDPSAYMTGPAKAASSYGLNKDLYTRSDVWRGAKVKPSSEVKDDTNPVLVKLAEELSKTTGGTKDTPGQVEISPARLGQALKQWIGAGPSGMALDKLTTSMFGEDVPDEVKRDAQEKWWAEIQKHPVLKNSFSLTDPDLPERSKRAVTEMKSNTQNLNLNNELDKLFKNGVLDEQGYAKFTEPLSDEDYRYVEQQVKEREKLSDSPAYWKSLRHLPVDVRITDITSKLERYKKNNPERFKAFKKEIDYNIDDVFDSDNQEVQEKLEVIDNLLRSN